MRQCLKEKKQFFLNFSYYISLPKKKASMVQLPTSFSLWGNCVNDLSEGWLGNLHQHGFTKCDKSCSRGQQTSRLPTAVLLGWRSYYVSTHPQESIKPLTTGRRSPWCFPVVGCLTDFFRHISLLVDWMKVSKTCSCILIFLFFFFYFCFVF